MAHTMIMCVHCTIISRQRFRTPRFLLLDLSHSIGFVANVGFRTLFLY